MRMGLIVAAALALAVLSARWFEEGDYYDPVRGRRHCSAPPSAIKDWSSTGRTRRPTDRINLDGWLEQNGDQVNSLFGAFCLAPLHTAARFGREDLAELLIVRGSDVNARERGSNRTPLDYALADSMNPDNRERMSQLLRAAGAGQ